MLVGDGNGAYVEVVPDDALRRRCLLDLADVSEAFGAKRRPERQRRTLEERTAPEFIQRTLPLGEGDDVARVGDDAVEDVVLRYGHHASAGAVLDASTRRSRTRLAAPESMLSSAAAKHASRSLNLPLVCKA